MKRGMKITFMLAVVLFGTSLTNAEIVFDNGEPSIYTDGKDMRSWLQADDFILNQDVILTGGHLNRMLKFGTVLWNILFLKITAEHQVQ